MDVFVTGATGQLGRATIPVLLKSGHRVRGLARSDRNVEAIRAMGAEPVRADLFDVGSLTAAVRGADAILHLATKIPPLMRMGWRPDWRANDRIRREGMRNLVDAALAEGVGTVLYESVTFLYPDSGDRWVQAGVEPRSRSVLQSTLDAEAEVERFTELGGRGIVLRFGAFYGPASPETHTQVAAARRGIFPIPGSFDAYLSSIWIPDAGSAVVAAVERAPAGVYDIVDDEPMRRGDVAAVFAREVGQTRLHAIPPSLFRLIAPAVAPFIMASQRVSNRRFKEVTGWEPSVASATAGLPLLVSGYSSSQGEQSPLASTVEQSRMSG